MFVARGTQPFWRLLFGKKIKSAIIWCIRPYFIYIAWKPSIALAFVRCKRTAVSFSLIYQFPFWTIHLSNGFNTNPSYVQAALDLIESFDLIQRSSDRKMMKKKKILRGVREVGEGANCVLVINSFNTSMSEFLSLQSKWSLQKRGDFEWERERELKICLYCFFSTPFSRICESDWNVWNCNKSIGILHWL